MRQHLWSTVALLVMVVFAFGSVGSNNGKQAGGGAQGPPPEVAKSALSVSPSEVISAYKTNEVAADLKYKDKWVKVTGQVDKVSKDIFDKIYVSFKSGERFEFVAVHCYFDDKFTAKAASLSPGQTISVLGKCGGKAGNVLFRDCEFVD